MSVWGHLAERFEGKEQEQHKLLTIDGGGIRGVMALEILAALEQRLADAHGIARDEFRLCDFFDYVGGTSTGAVIAAGIARGFSMPQMLEFYEQSGPAMFDNRLSSHIRSFFKRGTAYDAQLLATELRKMFGADATLEPEHLKCLLLAVTRNQTTDSPWPISSNPQAKYNDPSRADCNLRMPLWRIVRASTAAPMVYHAEEIQWGPDQQSRGLFVDGGVTPYNNPSWLLYRMATDPAYRLNWAIGEDKLLLVSIGTGMSSKGDDGAVIANNPFDRVWANRKLLGTLIQGAAIDQDTTCRRVGRCVYGARLDGELDDMIPRENNERIPLERDLGRDFLYARYNAQLDRDGLHALGLYDINEKNVQKLNSVMFIDELRRIGRRVAQGVDVDHFRPFIKTGPDRQAQPDQTG